MTKKKNFWLVACSVVMTAAMALAVTACAPGGDGGSTEAPPTLTAENIAPGVFKQYVDYETLASKVTGSYSIGARAEFWYEENTLILTNNVNPNRTNLDNPYKDESTTCRYELIKEMFIANRGFIHYQSYFGTYVFNEAEQTVTLNLPEYSYTYVWVGDNIATNPKREEYSSGLNGSSDGKYDPTRGFSYEFYNTMVATTSQEVRINLNDNSFSFVSVFEADDE